MTEFGNVVVTGGSGFIGSRLVNALACCSRSVTVLDNASMPVRSPSATYTRIDITATIRPDFLPEDVDCIFHLAGNPNGSKSVLDPIADFRANTLGTVQILQLAKACGARRTVVTSSASVYGTPRRIPIAETHPTAPLIPYGAAKLAAEQYAKVFTRTYGIDVVVVRPFCVYGPGEDPGRALVEVSRYLRWHLNGSPIPVVGDARRKTRDFIHVDDLVRGLIVIAKGGASGGVYNLGTGTETSMAELIEIIGACTGRTPRYEQLPHVLDDTYRLVADITKVRDLGFEPTVALERGVEELAERADAPPPLPAVPTIFTEEQARHDQELGVPR